VWHETEDVALEFSARECEFHHWVRQRLVGWTTAQILAFERWLHDQGEFDLIPAVRAARIERASAA
jgi:hypothetical protein